MHLIGAGGSGQPSVSEDDAEALQLRLMTHDVSWIAKKIGECSIHVPKLMKRTGRCATRGPLDMLPLYVS